MTDKNNIELLEGDLIMITFDKVIHRPAEIVVYKEMQTRTITCGSEDNIETVETNSLIYYPLTKEGLQVARFDTSTTQVDLLYRTKPFTVTNICSGNILKMEPDNLNSALRTYYDNITSLL
jgi:hypothetical protein